MSLNYQFVVKLAAVPDVCIVFYQFAAFASVNE